MPTVTTLGGWGAIIAIGVTFYFVSNQRKNKNRRTQPVKPSIKVDQTKGKKAKKDGGLSSGGEKDKKTRTKQKKVSAASKNDDSRAFTSALVADGKDEEEEKLKNREFARQLSQAKAGTVVGGQNSQAAARPKSVKQTRAQEQTNFEHPVEITTATSSTNGGDADDDRSPINSPDLKATTITSPVSNGDVSDMLEKPAGGPSVLRVTAPTNPQSQPKKSKQTASEPAMNKKQRQNQRKKEEAKAEREDAEKQRQALMEKQRRTAREAEGRAAKDGSAFMASKALSSSAWTASPSTNGKSSAEANKVELLDTYEQANGESSASKTKAMNGKSAPTDPELLSESQIQGSKLAAELAKLPEDEQIRIATEDSYEWKTVETKHKKKKPVTKGDDNAAEAKQGSAGEESDFVPPKKIAPTGPGKKWVVDVSYVDDEGAVHDSELAVQDSEWEVA